MRYLLALWCLFLGLVVGTLAPGLFQWIEDSRRLAAEAPCVEIALVEDAEATSWADPRPSPEWDGIAWCAACPENSQVECIAVKPPLPLESRQYVTCIEDRCWKCVEVNDEPLY